MADGEGKKSQYGGPNVPPGLGEPIWRTEKKGDAKEKPIWRTCLRGRHVG